MPQQPLIVLTFEGLPASVLSCFGCSWLETPGIDALASESQVFDRAIVPSLDPPHVLQQLLPWLHEGLPWDRQTHCKFVTNCPRACQLVTTSGQDVETLLVDEAEAPEPAPSVDETQWARLFGVALEQLAEAYATIDETSPPADSPLASGLATDEPPTVLWIHGRGLAGGWDAPLEFRVSDDLFDDEALDEDDEACETCVEPPQSIEELEASQETYSPSPSRVAVEQARLARGCEDVALTPDSDPDLLLAWTTAYGAQVRVLDTMISALRGATEGMGLTPTIVLAGTSGFALGEHGMIGPQAGPPRSNRIQVPLVVHIPGINPCRSVMPVSLASLATTLSNLAANLPALQPAALRGEETVTRNQPNPGNDASAVSHSEFSEPPEWCETDPLLEHVTPLGWAQPLESFAPVVHTHGAEQDHPSTLCTTPGWLYVRESDGTERLYLKPDDRHDFNDVADRQADVIQRFTAEI